MDGERPRANECGRGWGYESYELVFGNLRNLEELWWWEWWIIIIPYKLKEICFEDKSHFIGIYGLVEYEGFPFFFNLGLNLSLDSK